MTDYTMDDASNFYTQTKQEIYSLSCDISDLEERVKVPFDKDDQQEYDKIINRGKEIQEEIRWNEQRVVENENEELTPENFSFKGLLFELDNVMSQCDDFHVRKNSQKYGASQYIFDMVFYHKGCPDGQCAAWVYKRKMRDLGISSDKVLFIPMIAGKYPKETDVKDKRILMVDVCPKKEEIEEIIKTCEYLYILDHHESGETDVRDIKKSMNKNIHVIFDMKRCGAQIAWDYFYPKSEEIYLSMDLVDNRPWFIDVVADRDLWKWKYPTSKSLGAYLFFHRYWSSFDRWDSCLDNKIDSLMGVFDLEKMILEGNLLLEVEAREIKEAVRTAFLTDFTTPSGVDYKVRFVICKYSLASEVGNILSSMEDCSFAVMARYDYDTDEWWLSCRGKDKVNLSVLCKEFGGGGHPNAAGFSIKNEKGILQKMFRKIPIQK